MDRMSQRAVPSAGITLIELLITLLIFGVLVSAGAPSLRHVIDLNRLRMETNRLVSALNLTRSEAVHGNVPVSMCPADPARTGMPTCGGDYSDGWIVFRNPGRKTQPLDAEAQLIKTFPALPQGYSVTNRAGSRPAREMITFLPDGSSRRNRTLLICPPGSGERPSRSVVMNIVGRPRVAINWGQCPGV